MLSAQFVQPFLAIACGEDIEALVLQLFPKRSSQCFFVFYNEYFCHWFLDWFIHTRIKNIKSILSRV